MATAADQRALILLGECWEKRTPSTEWRKKYLQLLKDQQSNPAEFAHTLATHLVSRIYLGINPSPLWMSYLLEALQYQLIMPSSLFNLILDRPLSTSKEQFLSLMRAFTLYTKLLPNAPPSFSFSILDLTKMICEYTFQGVREYYSIRNSDLQSQSFNILCQREPVLHNALASIGLFDTILQDEKIIPIFLLAKQQTPDEYNRCALGISQLVNYLPDPTNFEFSEPFLKCASLFFQIPTRLSFNRASMFWKLTTIPRQSLSAYRMLRGWVMSKVNGFTFQDDSQDVELLKFISFTCCHSLRDFYIQLWSACYVTADLVQDPQILVLVLTFVFSRVTKLLRLMIPTSVREDVDLRGSLAYVFEPQHEATFLRPLSVSSDSKLSFAHHLAYSLVSHDLILMDSVRAYVTPAPVISSFLLNDPNIDHVGYFHAQSSILAQIRSTYDKTDIYLRFFLQNVLCCQSNEAAVSANYSVFGETRFLEFLRITELITEAIQVLWSLMEYCVGSEADDAKRQVTFESLLGLIHRVLSGVQFANGRQFLIYLEKCLPAALSQRAVAKHYFLWAFSQISRNQLLHFVNSQAAIITADDLVNSRIIGCWKTLLESLYAEKKAFIDQLVHTRTSLQVSDANAASVQEETYDFLMAIILIEEISRSGRKEAVYRHQVQILRSLAQRRPSVQWFSGLVLTRQRILPQCDAAAIISDYNLAPDGFIMKLRQVALNTTTGYHPRHMKECADILQNISDTELATLIFQVFEQYLSKHRSRLLEGDYDLFALVAALHCTVDAWCELVTKAILWVTTCENVVDMSYLAYFLVFLSTNLKPNTAIDTKKIESAARILIAFSCEILEYSFRDSKCKAAFAESVLILLSLVNDADQDWLSKYGEVDRVVEALRLAGHRDIVPHLPPAFHTNK